MSPTNEAAQPEDAWRPPVTFDLTTANPQALESAVNQMKAWFAGQTPTHLAISSGWHTVTPKMALDLLSRNRGNRRVTLATIRKYARSMQSDKWRRTGQGIVLDIQGRLIEGQHRLLACLWSGHSFTTFIVADASDEDDIFAFIDNGKARSAADALFTSGSNGCSKPLASAVNIAVRYDAGGFRVGSLPSMRPLEPYEVMDYVKDHRSMVEAAHMLVSNFAKGNKIIGHAGIATFFSWQVIERYGIGELSRFLEPLGSGARLEEDSPVLALRDRLRSAGDDDTKLTMQQRLGLLLKAFSMHYNGEKIAINPPKKRGHVAQPEGLFLADNEDFPQFPAASEMSEAAE